MPLVRRYAFRTCVLLCQSSLWLQNINELLLQRLTATQRAAWRQITPVIQSVHSCSYSGLGSAPFGTAAGRPHLLAQRINLTFYQHNSRCVAWWWLRWSPATAVLTAFCNVLHCPVLTPAAAVVHSCISRLKTLLLFAEVARDRDRDFYSTLFMAALCNRGPLYFCPVISFLLSFFLLLSFFPRLISAAVDRMSAILLHMAWP